MTAVIYTVVEALVAFMSVWSVIGLAGFHSYLVCCNITTNEDVSFLFIFDICLHYMHNSSVTNYFALVAAPSISISVACMSVRLHISKTTRSDFTKFSVCYLWPWLGPPLMTVQYIMYFSFVDNVWP